MSQKDHTKRTYHHGDLAEALIAATLEIVGESGLHNLSMREAAKRVGVSPAAPFRHFATKKALLTAVAENSMHKLWELMQREMGGVEGDDPLTIVEAIGRGYIIFAIENPTHFRILSARPMIDFDASDTLVGLNLMVQERMTQELMRAKDLGILSMKMDIREIVVGSRAMTYGLAGMVNDGHLRQWTLNGEARDAVLALLHGFVEQFRA